MDWTVLRQGEAFDTENITDGGVRAERVVAECRLAVAEGGALPGWVWAPISLATGELLAPFQQFGTPVPACGESDGGLLFALVY